MFIGKNQTSKVESKHVRFQSCYRFLRLHVQKTEQFFVLSLALSTVMYVIATSDKIFVMFINTLKCQFSFFFKCSGVTSILVWYGRIKQLGPVSLSTLCYCMQGSSQKVKWKQTSLLLEVISHSRCLLCRKVESLCKNSLCHPQPRSERLLRRDGPQAFRAQVLIIFIPPACRTPP